MNNASQLYEGMYIISATLSEDARKKAIEKITKSIEEKGGEIRSLIDWGRRKFAYQIQKRKEGFYYIVYFALCPKIMPEVWEEYKLNEDLVRFMTLKADEAFEKIEFKPLKHAE
ncbi:MAG: 30S ribosomal protein S6 [Simkaniaceae bacterium]